MMQSATVLAKTVTYDAARSGLASYSEAGASRGVLLPIGGEIFGRISGAKILREIHALVFRRR